MPLGKWPALRICSLLNRFLNQVTIIGSVTLSKRLVMPHFTCDVHYKVWLMRREREGDMLINMREFIHLPGEI